MTASEFSSAIQNYKDTTIIHSENDSGLKPYLIEVWRFRELFYLLAWRDLIVRYKQTVIGFAWAILRPLITVTIFTLVFGKVANLPSDNVPYLLFVFAAMLPWQFFSNALTEAGNSLISNSHIITKVYFPRILIPLSSIALCLFDALIVCGLFATLMIWYQILPSWKIIFLPIFIIWTGMLTINISILVSALNVTYRDFRHLIPFMVQLGIYVCPVGFSSSLVPEKWLWLYYINPLAAIIDGFRWCIFESTPSLPVGLMILPAFITLLISFMSLRYFIQSEDTIADRI